MCRFSKLKVLVVGRATLDVLIRSGGFPPWGEQAAIKEQLLLPGGTALNNAVTFADFGVNTSLCCKIGRDASAAMIEQFLKDRGVSLSFLRVDDYLPTSLSVINIKPGGEIAILNDVGANKNLVSGDLPASRLKAFSAVHLGGAMLLDGLDGSPAAEFLSMARQAGSVTSLSTTRNTRRRSVLLPVFPLLDVMFMNEREALGISRCHSKETACRWFHKQGVKAVVVTCGNGGAYVSDSGFTGLVPGIKVNPADTTGCGDAFVAGFLSVKLTGKDIRECAKWGNAVGAHCARTMGAVPVPFRPGEIEAMIESQERAGSCGALVLAGGLSRRMEEVDQKLVMSLAGKPLLVWVIESIRRAGVHRIVTILGHLAEMVKQSLRRQPVEFCTPAEQDAGTGTAVKATVSLLRDLPDVVYVINGDTPLVTPETLVQLREELLDSDAGVTAAVADSPDFRKYGHGAVILDDDGEFNGIEHFSSAAGKMKSGRVNTGTYCFRRDALIQGCRDLFPAADGKIHFSDILAVLKLKQIPVKLVHFPRFDEFISVNNRAQYLELAAKMREFSGERRRSD